MSKKYQGLITITDLTDNKSCEISGINVFKYNENGEILSSSSVTLTATLSENISGGNWQYKNSSGNFVNFSPANTGDTIVINHTDNIFINDVATIKKLTNDSSVFDIFTITKIRDGSPGDALINASLSNDNQTIPCDSNGVPFESSFPISSTITIYEGATDITNQYSISTTIQSDSGTPRLVGNLSGSTFTVTAWNTSAQSYYTATVTFTCTRDGYSPISKVLTLSKITTGSSPDYYELTYDILATNKDISKSFNPSSVTFRANHVNGSTITDYQGYLKLYRINLDGTQQTITTSNMVSDSSGGYKYTYTFSSSDDANTKYLSAELYKTGGTGDCLDKQSIVVTSDGQTGKEGQSSINIILGNVADVIPCNVNGKIKTNLTIDIPFIAYKGTSQISATISKSNITTRPSNLTDSDITITSSTSSSSGNIQLKFYADAELGADSGEISLIFNCDGKQVPMKYSWSKSIQAAQGEQGFSIVASVSRLSLTESEWTSYGTIGHSETWTNTSTIRNGCRINDIFTVVGTATDSKNAHVLYYRSTTSDGNLSGTCISHSIAERGAPGTSVTISSQSVMYQTSSDGTEIPTGTWSTDIPSVSNGQYLWTRTIVTYSTGTSTTSYSVSYKGTNGTNGTNGKSVSSITPQYYISTSKTTQTGGSWLDTMPTNWSVGKYLWIRNKVVYTNPSSTDYTNPWVDSSWEAINDLQIGGRNLALSSLNFDRREIIYNTSGTNKGIEIVEYDDRTAIKFTGENTVNIMGCYLLTPYTVTVKDSVITNSTFDADTFIISFDYKCESLLTTGSFQLRLFSYNESTDKYTNAGRLLSTTWPNAKLTATSNWERTNTTVLKINSPIVLDGTGTALTGDFQIGIGYVNTAGKVFEISRIKLEKGNKATDWTPAPEDVDNSINDAAKVAINYLHTDGSNGLIINNNETVGQGYDVQLKASGTDTGMNIRQDGNILASFFHNLVSLGKNSIDSKVEMCGGKGGVSAFFGYHIDSISSNNVEPGSTLSFDFNETTFKNKVGQKTGVYDFIYTAADGWRIFDYENDTTPTVTLTQYGITMKTPTSSINDNAGITIKYVLDGSVKFYNADISNPVRKLEFEMAENQSSSESDYANITIERQSGTYASGDGKEHSIITMMTLHEFANVSTLQLFDDEISMDASHLYLTSSYGEGAINLHGNTRVVGDVISLNGPIRSGWDDEPLIKYKTVSASYTITANSYKTVTFSSSGLHPTGYENYNVIGIARVSTGHLNVCKISGWYVTYKGDCSVTITNHGNSSAISSTTLTVNFIYAHDNLF